MSRRDTGGANQTLGELAETDRREMQAHNTVARPVCCLGRVASNFTALAPNLQTQWSAKKAPAHHESSLLAACCLELAALGAICSKPARPKRRGPASKTEAARPKHAHERAASVEPTA